MSQLPETHSYEALDQMQFLSTVKEGFPPLLQRRDRQTFSIKGQKLNNLGFSGYTVSAATPQLYSCDWHVRVYKSLLHTPSLSVLRKAHQGRCDVFIVPPLEMRNGGSENFRDRPESHSQVGAEQERGSRGALHHVSAPSAVVCFHLAGGECTRKASRTFTLAPRPPGKWHFCSRDEHSFLPSHQLSWRLRRWSGPSTFFWAALRHGEGGTEFHYRAHLKCVLFPFPEGLWKFRLGRCRQTWVWILGLSRNVHATWDRLLNLWASLSSIQWSQKRAAIMRWLWD